MNAFIKRCALFLGRWRVVNHHDRPSEFQFPLPRVIVIALLACLVSLLFIYWAARPVVERLEVWWVEWLVYALIPIAVTFIILYCSSWHREITGAARTCSLLLLSCVILGGLLFAIGISVFVVWFCSQSLPKAGGR
jgi:cytochrome bd-type quinol oxidase subunit 2